MQYKSDTPLIVFSNGNIKKYIDIGQITTEQLKDNMSKIEKNIIDECKKKEHKTLYSLLYDISYKKATDDEYMIYSLELTKRECLKSIKSKVLKLYMKNTTYIPAVVQ